MRPGISISANPAEACVKSRLTALSTSTRELTYTVTLATVGLPYEPSSVHPVVLQWILPAIFISPTRTIKSFARYRRTESLPPSPATAKRAFLATTGLRSRPSSTSRRGLPWIRLEIFTSSTYSTFVCARSPGRLSPPCSAAAQAFPTAFPQSRLPPSPMLLEWTRRGTSSSLTAFSRVSAGSTPKA